MRTEQIMTTIAGAVLLVPALAVAQSTEDAMRAVMETTNAQLAAANAPYQVDRVHYLTISGDVGTTIFFDDRTKQMDADYVPGDERRIWNSFWGLSTEISWMSDLSDGTAPGTAPGVPTLAQTQTAIDNAMATWEGQTCSTIPLVKLGFPGLDLSLIEAVYWGGGYPLGFPLADITHAGWVAPELLPPTTLAVTFTLVFLEGGNPTDVDGNGKVDTAWSEIYYRGFSGWAVDGNDIDVETVALHEAAHGLSQDHFGTLFRTDRNGMFHYAPRAVMNAGYSGVQRALTGTDVGGHCSIWEGWPYE